MSGVSSGSRNITLLGASGSIGASTLDVVLRHPEHYRLFAVTAHNSAEALLEICQRHRPRMAVLSGLAEDRMLRRHFAEAGGTELRFGSAALEEVAAHPDCDTVMAAIVGAAGLAASLAAASAGKRVLLANKEALVLAGAPFMAAVRKSGALLLPVDSEHNAVFQCLAESRGAAGRAVRRIVLTASGGPFLDVPLETLDRVTPDQACAHPNWVMGRKISVDSATMMNKGLEVIEARWLFDLAPERIEVLIHPQSIVHALVEFADGSVIAQMSNPDMRVPIAHALAHPERVETGVKPLDLACVGRLTFQKPDHGRFPCLAIAHAALRAGGGAPAVLNAANEVAVEAFLAGQLRFTAIAQVIEETMRRVPAGAGDTLESVLEADRRARRSAQSSIAALLGNAA